MRKPSPLLMGRCFCVWLTGQRLASQERVGRSVQKRTSTAIDVTLDLVHSVLSQEWPMTNLMVRWPHCRNDQIVKRDQTARAHSMARIRMSSVPPHPLEDRTQASDATDTYQALALQDKLLVQSDTNAQHCPWLVCEPLAFDVQGKCGHPHF